MKSLAKIFTKDRLVIIAVITGIFGVITTLITVFGGSVIARSEAASQVQEDLNAFKATTIADIAEIKGTVNEMRNRLEDIKGINQDMQSRLNNFLDNQ